MPKTTPEYYRQITYTMAEFIMNPTPLPEDGNRSTFQNIIFGILDNGKK
jgi:hypothetical protein